MVTGYELPWDQFAFRSVRVGSNSSGFGLVFDDDVRFVLIGGREVDPGTLTRWLVLHAALLGPLVVSLAVVVWRRRSSSDQIT
jgi:quinol-cytochrome oxidoreductase complex cytochrome b subunit